MKMKIKTAKLSKFDIDILSKFLKFEIVLLYQFNFGVLKNAFTQTLEHLYSTKMTEGSRVGSTQKYPLSIISCTYFIFSNVT